ncbi:flagellar biosynthetic protein FliO [Xanthomonas sontii]|uniref:flagellar biosynthetic protein FliO n=1 Tax=Xanthomonas sontii TaxID=2650745 RepID=UPI003F825939
MSLAVTFAAIPYRRTGVVEMSDVGQVILCTVLLLAIAVVALVALKRKGWLGRWLGESATADQAPAIRRIAQTRLSRGTVVHLIEVTGRRLVVVESKSHIRMLPSDAVESHDPNL